MKKYYCDVCSDEFTRRWNLGRHRQTTHGSKPTSDQSSQLGNLSTDALGASDFSKTSNIPEVFDVFCKMNTLEELGEINANLSTIVSILKDMQNAKK
jgi:hypothetical protein